MSPLRRAASACASRPNATAPAVAYTRVLKFPHASVEAGYMRLRTASGALLAVALLVGTAGAQGNAALQAQIQTLIGQVGVAAAAALAQNDQAAAANLADARALLTQIIALADDPATVQDVGALARRLARKLAALQRLLGRTQTAVDNPAVHTNKRIRALKVAYARVTGVATLAGKPILVETNSRSAGFHRPGDVVTFRVLGPDGGPCTEAPQVVVENQFGATAVDLASVHQEADGTLALTMGDQAGGAKVTVTACGQSSTRLLFNDGPKSVPGLPTGFPAGLPQGSYVISFSASGAATIPETPLATIPNLGARAFAQALVKAFQGVAAAYASPDCSIAVHYSPFDGESFTATYSVTCTVDQATATETVVFRVRRA